MLILGEEYILAAFNVHLMALGNKSHTLCWLFMLNGG